MTNERLTRALTAADRVATAEEARAYLEAPVSAEERESCLGLVRWFRRRYPSPAARLAYARRAYARWRSAHPSSR